MYTLIKAVFCCVLHSYFQNINDIVKVQTTPTTTKKNLQRILCNWIKMTDQKAEVDIGNVERYARVDKKPESDGNLMNPNKSGTLKSM